jgi:hypothetical protein
MGKLATTGNSRTRNRLADLRAVPAFNPVTDIGWAHLYWAGGPAFQGIAPANNASMSGTNWPDEIAANAANLNAGAGLYRTADASMNSKPSLAVGSGNAGKRHSTTVAGGAQVSLPYSIVLIFQLNSTAGYVVDGANEGGSGNRVLFRVSSGPVWSLYMGIDRTGGTPTTGLKAVRISATSGNDLATVNGSTVISGVEASGGTWQGMSITEGGAEFSGNFAFYGVYAGDITGAGNWAAFQAWVTSEYGVSIS